MFRNWLKKWLPTSKKPHRTQPVHKASLTVETLERRDLMAAGLTSSLANGILTIQTTPAADQIVLRQANNRLSIVGVPGSYAAAKVKRVMVEGFEANDKIKVAAGPQKIAKPIFVHWNTGKLEKRSPAGIWTTLFSPPAVEKQSPAPIPNEGESPAPWPNWAPELAPIANQKLKSGQSVTIDLSATDRDGDRITYSAAVIAQDWATTTVVGQEQPLQISLEGNRLTITTAKDWTGGKATIEVKASDGRGWDVEKFEVVVAENHAPVLAAIEEQKVAYATKLEVSLKGSDADGDVIAFSTKFVEGGVGADEVEMIVAGTHLTIYPHRFSGNFTVEVAASDGISTSTTRFQVTIAPPVTVDPNIYVSPIDGSVWELRDASLYCNGTVVQSDVGKFTMLPNGDRLMIYHQVEISKWGWIIGGHSVFERFHRGGTSSYKDFNDFAVRPNGDILAWGVTLDRWRGDRHETLATDVRSIDKIDEDYLVLKNDRTLSRYRDDAVMQIASGVEQFDVYLDQAYLLKSDRTMATYGDGQVTQVAADVIHYSLADDKLAITTADGLTETTMLTGDLVSFMRTALENEPQSPTPTEPSGPGRGVIGHINVVGEIMAEYGGAKAPKSILSSVGRIDVARAGQRLKGGSGTLLYWGDNQYVLTAAHVVEDASGAPLRPDAFTTITFNLAYAHQNNLVAVNLAGVEVDGVFGRDHFDNRDLALLHLRHPVREVFGAHLPDNDIPLEMRKLLLVGYGLDGVNDQTKNLNFGYGTMDREREVVNQNYPSGRPFMRGEHVVNVYHADDGEAAVAVGDSGGPAFLAQTKVFDGDTYLAPTIVGVHSAIDDANDDGVPADGEATYSVQITAAVARLIKSYIPYRHVKVADYQLHVIENGDPDIAGNGEWVDVQFGVNGRVWTNPRDELSLGDNSYFAFPSPTGAAAWRDDLTTTNVKWLDLHFYAKHEYDPIGDDDLILPWNGKVEVAWFKGRYGTWQNVSGVVKPFNEDTQYSIEVMVGWEWVRTN